MTYIDKINKINFFHQIDWNTVGTARYWYQNDPIVTHLFNILSLIIPETERFIVKSLKPYEDSFLDPELSTRIKSFFVEEYAHSLQHTRFNEDLKRHDYPIDFIAKFVRANYKLIEKLTSAKTRVAISTCFEHLTVVVAIASFEKELLEPGYTVITDLFLWHSYEELSHRTFLMDVYHALGGGYIRRVIAMAIISIFIYVLLGPIILCALVILDLVNRRGIKLRHVKSAIKFMWNLRKGLKYYFLFYKFHFDPETVFKLDAGSNDLKYRLVFI